MGEIRESIIESIAMGAEVRSAYLRTAGIAAEVVERRSRSGEDVEEILHDLGVTAASDVAKRLRFEGEFSFAFYIVIGGGGVADVPDPVCVAEQLKSRPKPPSRRDIEEAFEACRKRSTGFASGAGA